MFIHAPSFSRYLDSNVYGCFNLEEKAEAVSGGGIRCLKLILQLSFVEVLPGLLEQRCITVWRVCLCRRLCNDISRTSGRLSVSLGPARQHVHGECSPCPWASLPPPRAANRLRVLLGSSCLLGSWFFFLGSCCVPYS